MGKVQVGRALKVDSAADVVRQRLDTFARQYEFAVEAQLGSTIELHRGSTLGNLTSFDVQKVTSTLTVVIEPHDGSTSVTATLVAGSFFQIFTAGDRATLEKQMDVLVGTLRGG